MPFFLWRSEYGRRRLSSKNESHWLQVSAYKLLAYYSSNNDMQNFQQHIDSLLYSVAFTKKINVLKLRHRCFPGNVRFFLKQQIQPPEVFHKNGAVKNFVIFTRKRLCWSLFGVFGVNFIKKRHQHRYFPVNITKFLRTPILKNIYEHLYLKQLF